MSFFTGFSEYLQNLFKREFIGVKAKYLLITMLIVISIIGSIVWFIFISAKGIEEKTVNESQLRIASEATITTEVWLKQQVNILEAAVFAVKKTGIGNKDEILRILETTMKAGDFSDVYIGLTDGSIIDGARWIPPPGYDTRVRPWFNAAVDAGHTTFSKPYIDLTTMSLVIALASPMYINNKFAGVISSDIILDTLVESLSSLQIGNTGYAFIVDKEGMILVHKNKNLVMKSKIQDFEPELNNITSNFVSAPSGIVKYGKNQKKILAYNRIDITGWYLCTIVPKSEAVAFSQNSAILYSSEKILKVLGVLFLLTTAGVGGSALILYAYSRTFQTTVHKYEEEMTGINENLRLQTIRREELETYYQTIFTVANDAIILMKGFIIFDSNDKALELFGISKRNFMGRPLISFSADIQSDGGKSNKKFIDIMHKSEQGEQQSFVWTFKKADGREFPTEVSLKTVEIKNESLTLLSIRDISKRAAVEEQLRQTQKLAAMGEMLGSIAHQWRQPLNTLSTYIASFQSIYYNDKVNPVAVKKIALGAETQIQFMSKTIDDFRNFLKPSKKKIVFEMVEILEKTIKLIEPQLKQKSIDLKVQYHSYQNLNVLGYPSEFIHVLINIITNSQDAIIANNSKSNKEGKKQISLQLQNPDNYVVLTISDSGGGIPKKILNKIFEPYFTTKGTASGMGIGLYMAKMIVEKEMGGVIFAENIVNGACFTIKLPKI
ncbi:sensor histidine kinase [Flexistipes sp.]|uniref:sensor histidine kinase n=1 Tax=Flexistipes sp. TaxID=3088135 RepID=UPI002E1CE6EA|nr:cache domain-containing protein [Flexistipes sp.]